MSIRRFASTVRYNIITPEFIKARSTPTGTISASGGTFDFQFTGGTAEEGELIILIFNCSTTRTISNPSGFTSLFSVTSVPMLRVLYKIAGPSEVNSYVFTNNSTANATGAVHGYIIKNANNVESIGSNSGNSNGANCSSADVLATKKSILIGMLSVEKANGGSDSSYSNSFSKIPSGGTSNGSTAYRFYSTETPNQNTSATFTGTTAPWRTRIIKISYTP
jgi:hypothetical protein